MQPASSVSCVAALAAVALVGCGSKEAPPKRATSAVASSSAAAASAKPVAAQASASAAPPRTSTGPKVPVAKLDYKTVEKKPASLGGHSVEAAICSWDAAGAPPGASSFDDPIRGFALAPDDAVLLIDASGAVRRYRDQGEGACELALDRTFGKDGVLKMELGEADDRLVVDERGAIYVSTGFGQKRILNGVISDVCDTTNRPAAGRRSSVVYLGKRKLAGTECPEDTSLEVWKDDPFTEAARVEKDGITFMGTFDRGNGFRTSQAAFNDFSGKRVVVVGDQDGEGSCLSVHDVFRSSLGLSVVDLNGSSLRVWTLAGKLVGALNVDDTVGVDLVPLFGQASGPEDRTTWIAAAGRSATKDEYLPLVAKLEISP
ncbi:MAG: hypothetical protein U0414_42625 [Polyangiaceae bacterium]